MAEHAQDLVEGLRVGQRDQHQRGPGVAPVRRIGVELPAVGQEVIGSSRPGSRRRSSGRHSRSAAKATIRHAPRSLPRAPRAAPTAGSNGRTAITSG